MQLLSFTDSLEVDEHLLAHDVKIRACGGVVDGDLHDVIASLRCFEVPMSVVTSHAGKSAYAVHEGTVELHRLQRHLRVQLPAISFSLDD